MLLKLHLKHLLEDSAPEVSLFASEEEGEVTKPCKHRRPRARGAERAEWGIAQKRAGLSRTPPWANVPLTDSKLPALSSHTSFCWKPQQLVVGETPITFSEIHVIRHCWTEAPHSSRTQTFLRTPPGLTLLFLHRGTVPFWDLSV